VVHGSLLLINPNISTLVLIGFSDFKWPLIVGVVCGAMSFALLVVLLVSANERVLTRANEIAADRKTARSRTGSDASQNTATSNEIELGEIHSSGG